MRVPPSDPQQNWFTPLLRWLQRPGAPMVFLFVLTYKLGESSMGPMIKPPSGDLETALKVLEPGEEWAVMPQPVEGNPCLWTPGVKYGVRPGSYTHMTEFFGPVLAVMRFTNLREAVALVNQTGYGLTTGLESLDEREWDYWLEHIRAGNLYVNRVTTGAIVLRQKWSRGQVEARLANTPPCLIGMEACVGAHHLSRKLKALGHDARLRAAVAAIVLRGDLAAPGA